MEFLEKNSKKIILGILALSLIGIFWRFGTLLYFPAAGDFLEKGELVKLHPKETLEQTFASPKDNLARIEIILRSPGIKEGDKVEAKLLDADCQKTLQQSFLEDSFLSSSNLYDFSFPIIPDSKSKNYCLSLSFQPEKETAKSLQFFYHPEPGISFRNISTGESFSDQSLSFRLAYKNGSLWENLVELNQRISQYKPDFLKGISLAVIFLGFIILSLFLIISIIFL